MLLKITSDQGTIITYINLENVFSIKSHDREESFNIEFYSINGNKTESFCFTSKKERDQYLKDLESYISKEVIIVDDNNFAGEEEDIEFTLDNYDPMSNLEEKKDNE